MQGRWRTCEEADPDGQEEAPCDICGVAQLRHEGALEQPPELCAPAAPQMPPIRRHSEPCQLHTGGHIHRKLSREPLKSKRIASAGTGWPDDPRSSQAIT